MDNFPHHIVPVCRDFETITGDNGLYALWLYMSDIDPNEDPLTRMRVLDDHRSGTSFR